jgi:fucose 4-O-acetylase-like acetyltransferase
MNKNLLTFEYMNQFKGVLILLIIAGHIEGLVSEAVNASLYSFHVSSFFFLPFLFNNDKLSFLNIIKIFKRYFIPYTIFFLITYIAYKVIFKSTITVTDTFLDWLVGTMFTIKEAIGIGAYWFFPALIAILVIIMLYNTLSDSWKKIFLVIFLILHLFIGLYAYPSTVLQHIPFNLYIPFYLFSLGYIIKKIIYTVELNQKRLIIISLIFIVSLIVSYFYGEKFNIASPYFPSLLNRPMDFILRDTLMLSGFFSILYISKYAVFATTFGKYSIAIYTLHPLVLQTVNLILRSETFFVSLIKFFIVLAVTFILAHTIYKLNINKFIYPK